MSSYIFYIKINGSSTFICASVLLALRTRTSCYQQTVTLYQAVLHVIAFILSVAIKLAMLVNMLFSGKQARDKLVDFASFAVYIGFTWKLDLI